MTSSSPPHGRSFSGKYTSPIPPIAAAAAVSDDDQNQNFTAASAAGYHTQHPHPGHRLAMKPTESRDQNANNLVTVIPASVAEIEDSSRRVSTGTRESTEDFLDTDSLDEPINGINTAVRLLFIYLHAYLRAIIVRDNTSY